MRARLLLGQRLREGWTEGFLDGAGEAEGEGDGAGVDALTGTVARGWFVVASVDD
jgi:hypothetical protein